MHYRGVQNYILSRNCCWWKQQHWCIGGLFCLRDESLAAGTLALSSTDRQRGPYEYARHWKGAEIIAQVRDDRTNRREGREGGHVVYHYALHGGNGEDVELLERLVQQLFVLLVTPRLLRPELAAIGPRTPPARPRKRLGIRTERKGANPPLWWIRREDWAGFRRGDECLAWGSTRTFAANPRYCAWLGP